MANKRPRPLNPSDPEYRAMNGQQILANTGLSATLIRSNDTELAQLQPQLAAGFVSTTPEISRLGSVERIERVASLGIADLSA